ncbi:MAG: hypothetical protein HC869_15620, partial [Rhodospirillales bacterium]|nr:hypothetical protein [Rhodospirillales bacterium]
MRVMVGSHEGAGSNEVAVDFLLSDDQKKLQDSIAEFARERIAPQAEARDREARFPVELFQELGRMGVTAIPFGPEWGGLGLGVFDAALALEEIARADQSLAVSAMVSMATGLTLSRFGSKALKERYLPDIVAGRRICAIAGTEPNAGSDTAGFKTTARRAANNGWVLNGEKAFITNSGTEITSFALVLAVTSPAAAERKSFTLFAVPAKAPGFATGEPYRKMGWRSSDTAELYLDNLHVPHDALLGEEGKGFRYILDGMNAERILVASDSLGDARWFTEKAVAYAGQRVIFGKPIGANQGVQFPIAKAHVNIEPPISCAPRRPGCSTRASLRPRGQHGQVPGPR